MNRPDNPAVLTVADLTQGIKLLLENNFHSIWIRGEISNFKRHTSGHLYFTLKDDRAQISAAMFRSDAIRCQAPIRDGMQVMVLGNVSVYEQRGNYQIIVRELIEEGLGRLQVEFEKLKRKLDAEGLFDQTRKKPLPLLPRTVGVVTSITGAAIRDFLSILDRRAWKGRVLVFPASVQGREAIPQIIEQIELAGQCGLLDLLVVGRGGGSLEDLWCFNEEAVVRAVAASPVPTISAVGHEIDFVLTDFAADRRAETPSAAAELISSSFLEARQRLESARERVLRHTTNQRSLYRSEIARISEKLARHTPRHLIENRYLRTDDLANRLQAAWAIHRESRLRSLDSLAQGLREHHPAKTLLNQRERMASLSQRLSRTSQNFSKTHHKHTDGLAIRLENLSVQKVLSRGFVMMRDAKGRIIQNSLPLKDRQELSATFRDGEVRVRVNKDPQMELL